MGLRPDPTFWKISSNHGTLSQFDKIFWFSYHLSLLWFGANMAKQWYNLIHLNTDNHNNKFCQKLVNSNLHHQIHKLDYSKSLHICRLQPIEIRNILQKQKKWFVFVYIIKERARLTLIGRRQQWRALPWRWLVVNQITINECSFKTKVSVLSFSSSKWKSYVFGFCRLME